MFIDKRQNKELAWGLPFSINPLKIERTKEEYNKLFKDKIVLSFDYDAEGITIIVNGEMIGIVEQISLSASSSSPKLNLKISWASICSQDWWDQNPEMKIKNPELYENFKSRFSYYQNYIKIIKDIIPWADLSFTNS